MKNCRFLQSKLEFKQLKLIIESSFYTFIITTRREIVKDFFRPEAVNGFKRRSPNGKCSYETGRMFMPEDFFLRLGLEQIPPDEVNLTPSLLR